MICCEKCFTDIVIKSEIIGLGNKGNCEICGSRDVYIYMIVNIILMTQILKSG